MDNIPKKFQSTQPEWAATNGTRYGNVSIAVFQSTQPEWAATRNPGGSRCGLE